MASKNKGGIVALVIAALLLLFLSGKKPPGTGQAALPGGNIAGVVTLSQLYHARAHLVTKRVGDTVTVMVTWTAATRNAAGQPIDWNYAISWRYIRATSGDLINGGFSRIGSKPNGTFTFTGSSSLVGVSLLGNYSAEVTLHADTSSSAGTPNNDAVDDDALVIGFGEHKNAFQIV